MRVRRGTKRLTSPGGVLLLLVVPVGTSAHSKPSFQPTAGGGQSSDSAEDQAKQAVQFGFRFFPEFWGSPPDKDGPLMKGTWTVLPTANCAPGHTCRMVVYVVKSPIDGSTLKCGWLYDLNAGHITQTDNQARQFFFQLTPETIQAERDAIGVIKGTQTLKPSAVEELPALEHGQWMAFPSAASVRGAHVYHVYYVVDVDTSQTIWCHWVLDKDKRSVTPDASATRYFGRE